MTPNRRASRRRLIVGIALACTLALTFAGCANGSAPSSTITAAQILQRIQQAPLRDAQFLLTLDLTSGGTHDRFVGNGTLTIVPRRTEITLTATILDRPVSVEEIIDGTTTYTAFSTNTNWTITPSSQSPLGIDLGAFFDTTRLVQPNLIGAEVIDGVATYHLRATNTGTNSMQDLWVRQDSYYPVQSSLLLATDTSGSVTARYTRHDAGLKIGLPSRTR